MKRKQFLMVLLDIAIVILAVLSIRLSYIWISVLWVKWMLIALITVVILSILIREISSAYYNTHRKEVSALPGIIALINEYGEPVKVWDLNRQIGMLIGKDNGDVDADIDLSESAFNAFIDHEHCVLNYTHSGWWIEDLNSTNGTSIRRNEKTILLATGAPNRILPGDIIVLGEETRLAVQ